jgi:hypothetical protein
MIDADDLAEAVDNAVEVRGRAGQPPSDTACAEAAARLRRELGRLVRDLPDEATVRDLREALS